MAEHFWLTLGVIYDLQNQFFLWIDQVIWLHQKMHIKYAKSDDEEKSNNPTSSSHQSNTFHFDTCRARCLFHSSKNRVASQRTSQYFNIYVISHRNMDFIFAEWQKLTPNCHEHGKSHRPFIVE